jgi:type IV secretory pathway TraG/TraD family ATPase VirD4
MSRPGPRGGSDDAGLFVGAAALLLLLTTAVMWLPVALAHPPGYRGGNPFTVAGDLIHGRIHWTTPCTLLAVAELAVAGGLVALVVAGWSRWRRGRTRVDPAARHMASRRDLAQLGPAGVAESARRLRPSLAGQRHPTGDETGVLIGRTLVGGMPLRQSWEDMAIDIWGPRTGKTTSRAIPAIVAAPGPVLVTSVKGDVVDATRDPRGERGRVWVFDPQAVLGEPAGWWWNPLAGITTITDARRLAAHFAAADRGADVQRDAFFDPEAEELVANLLLAAAASGADILQAYRWSVSARDEQPALELAKRGYPLPAEGVSAVINLPDKTRGGIYAGAKKLLNCLTEPSVTQWITPQPGRTQFDVAAFVRSRDTLYLLSQGGAGSPAPLVAAFTDAVLHAGELLSTTLPGRRLDPPLLSVLDEAANICRIRELPNLYSHYGSRGLPVITILQSYAQGVDVWGRESMRKLWSAANVRTYGGGVAEPDFLDELSRLIGEHDVTVRSTTTTGATWERSVNQSPRRQRILDVAELGAIPRGRMVILASGTPPALARTCPWQDGPYAAAIRASLAHWDPQTTYDTTLTTTLDPQPEATP